MKSLTHSLLLLLLTGTLSMQTNLYAAETIYAGELKGVECTSCKRTVAKAVGKIKGVKTIRIVKKSEKIQRLEVTTDGSTTLTKAMVVKAIADAKHYQITRWGKQSS